MSRIFDSFLGDGPALVVAGFLLSLLKLANGNRRITLNSSPARFYLSTCRLFKCRFGNKETNVLLTQGRTLGKKTQVAFEARRSAVFALPGDLLNAFETYRFSGQRGHPRTTYNCGLTYGLNRFNCKPNPVSINLRIRQKQLYLKPTTPLATTVCITLFIPNLYNYSTFDNSS